MKQNHKVYKFAPQMYSVLKELQESAYYWSEYDVPLGIVDRINDVLKKVESNKMADRKQYQKKYQKDYAASGKKSEAAKRYYQKHKFEICERLKNKRKPKYMIDNSVEITSMLGHKFNKK